MMNFKLIEYPANLKQPKASALLFPTESRVHITSAELSGVVLWLLKLLKDFGREEVMAIEMKEANQNRVRLSECKKMNTRTKDIDKRSHLLCDLTEEKALSDDLLLISWPSH